MSQPDVMWPPDPSNVQGLDDCLWQSSMPRETLLHVFLMLPLKDRCVALSNLFQPDTHHDPCHHLEHLRALPTHPPTSPYLLVLQASIQAPTLSPKAFPCAS